MASRWDNLPKINVNSCRSECARFAVRFFLVPFNKHIGQCEALGYQQNAMGLQRSFGNFGVNFIANLMLGGEGG